MRADVHRIHAFGALLKKAVGKTAGGSAHIQTNSAVGIKFQIVERAIELFSPARDVAVGLGQGDGGARFNGLAGFDDRFSVEQNAPGQNKGLRFGARGGQSEFNKSVIEAGFCGRGNG